MDLVAVGGVDVVLRRFLRRRAGLHSMDDHGGALLAGPATRSHVSSCPHQLVNIFCSNSFELFEDMGNDDFSNLFQILVLSQDMLDKI